MSRKFTNSMKRDMERKFVDSLKGILYITTSVKRKPEISPRQLLLSNDDVDLTRLCRFFDDCAYSNNIETPGGMLYMYQEFCGNFEHCGEYLRKICDYN